MVPTPSVLSGGNLTVGTNTFVGVPSAERMSLQQEAQALLEQVDQAHSLLDGIMQAPTNGQANTPALPLSAAIQEARVRMNVLNNRLSLLSQQVGVL